MPPPLFRALGEILCVAVSAVPWYTFLDREGTVREDRMVKIFLVEDESTIRETLRDSARQAGVHIYADQPCLVWAGRNLLAVHTGTGGTIRFSLKQKAGQISELFSGTKINCGGSGFSYTFASPETALFLLEPEQETE